MAEPRNLLKKVVPAAILELVVWFPVGGLIDAASKSLFGRDFEMADFLSEYLPLLRGVGIGAVIAFVIDDFLSPRSWVVSAWRNWRGSRATIVLRFNPGDSRVLDCEVAVKLGRNSGRVLLTGRAARLVHYLDGTAQWKWETPLVTLWETANGSKGEEAQRHVFLRRPEDAHKVSVFDRDLPIEELCLLLIEVTLNVEGRVETIRKVFEVYVPDRPITRIMDPSCLTYTPKEPS